MIYLYKMKQQPYIYRKQIKATGRYYIGKHNGNNKWYKGSGTDWLVDLKIYVKDPKVDLGVGEILEYVGDVSNLNGREEYWLQSVDAANNLLYYNRTNKSSGCSTEESRKKLSEKLKNHSSFKNNIKRAKKISNSLKNNIQRGEKISNSLKNKPKSEEHKQNMKKPKPEGFNDKLKKKIVQMDKNLNTIYVYNSLTEASKINNINLQGINNCVLGKSKSSGGLYGSFLNLIT